MSASIRKAILGRFKEFPRIADRGVKHIALQEGVKVEDVYAELDRLEHEQTIVVSRSISGGEGWMLNTTSIDVTPPADPEIKAPTVKVKPGAKKASKVEPAFPVQHLPPGTFLLEDMKAEVVAPEVVPVQAEPAKSESTRRITLSELAVEIPVEVLEKLAATKRLAVAYEKHPEFSGPLDAMFIEAALEFEVAASKVLGTDTLEAKSKAAPTQSEKQSAGPRVLVVSYGPSFAATVKNIFIDNPGVLYLKDISHALRSHPSVKSLAPTLSGFVRDGYLARVGTGAYTRVL
jgi:hypothetical protein